MFWGMFQGWVQRIGLGNDLGIGLRNCLGNGPGKVLGTGSGIGL